MPASRSPVARLVNSAVYRAGNLVLLGVGIAGCSDTTDTEVTTYLTIAAASPVLLRGQQQALTATVWQRTSPGDSVEIRNVELVWTTTDPTLATVAAQDNRTATVTGVNPGLVTLTATATSFQGAEPAEFDLRVANPLEIDSMRPAVVRWGEKVTMYGIGVSNLFFASLEGAALFPDTFSVALTGGLEQISFWVPPPASTGHVFALGPGLNVVAPDSTTVVRQDLYEPNELAPRAVDLDGALPFPAVPQVRVFNPALAFEEVDRAEVAGLDWYRFSSAAAGRDLTFIFNAPTFAGAHRTFLSAATPDASDLTNSSWTIGSGLYHCKGYPFSVEEQPADSLLVALRDVPSGTLDLVSQYFVPGRYGLAVLDGYHTAEPAIGPDRFEENDTCDFADRTFLAPATQIDLTAEFSDSLTVDNPHDVDWIRFRVPGAVPQPVTIRSEARAGPGSAANASDIDLYLLTVPGGPLGLEPRGLSRSTGSSETLSVILDPGDYYLVVTDYAGVPTRYALCAALGPACTLPAGVAP